MSEKSNIPSKQFEQQFMRYIGIHDKFNSPIDLDSQNRDKIIIRLIEQNNDLKDALQLDSNRHWAMNMMLLLCGFTSGIFWREIVSLIKGLL